MSFLDDVLFLGDVLLQAMSLLSDVSSWAMPRAVDLLAFLDPLRNLTLCLTLTSGQRSGRDGTICNKSN